MTKYYKCKFLSDVVLQASSNTQGNVQLADSIAGSNFLGMVAGGYNEFKKKAFRVFHSGDVRFGDGHIAVNGKESYKVPLSYFNLKIGEGLYNRIHLSDDEEQELRDERKQLKQIRSGFMNSDAKYCKPSYNYSQKSKHSKKYRRSEDEGMFGYSALKKDTEWFFKVVYKDDTLVEDIEKFLLGRKRLGKSKSSQYGQVFIEPVANRDKVEIFTPSDDYTYLYLNSRVALVDAFGNPALTPTLENLGLESGKIDWGKTQIKSSTYHPYNYTRQTKEYTRVVLDKGGVIVLTGVSDADKEKIEQGLGAYLSEGFGEIIVNPIFLETKYPLLEEVNAKLNFDKDSSKIDKVLVSFLKNREEEEEDKFAVASEVQKIYKSLMGASKSQWGEIRSMASMVNTKAELLTNIENFITNGVAKKQWEGNKLLFEIQKSNTPIAFTKLVAKICREHTKGGDNE